MIDRLRKILNGIAEGVIRGLIIVANGGGVYIN